MGLFFDGDTWTVRNTPEIVWERSGDETVLINLETGFYFSLNKCGSDVWEQALSTNGGPVSYPGSGQELTDFLHELRLHNLVINQKTQAAGVTSDNRDLEGSPILYAHSDLAELLLLDPIHDVDGEQGWPETSRAN